MSTLREAVNAYADGLERRAGGSRTAVAGVWGEVATRLRSLLTQFPDLIAYTEWGWRDGAGHYHTYDNKPACTATLVRRTVTAWEDADGPAR